MHQFTNLQDLSTGELLELLYYIERMKVEKEEFVDFYENLLDIQKTVWVNTDVEERQIRDIIEKFLLVSEKESLTQLYKLSEKRLGAIKASLENIKIDVRFKKFGQYIFQTDIQTLPIKIKQLDLGNIDKISEVSLSDLGKQLNEVEFKIAQKGAVKAKADLKLRNVPRITAVKGQIATRIRDFTGVVGANIQSKLKAEILAGIKAGEGTSDIAKRIRAVYKKPVPVTVKPLIRDGKQIHAGYSYGISNKRWSEMVARSESSWSVNQGRVEAYKSSGLVRNVVWQTADNPCPDCAIMEGQVLELYEAENMIPYHVHCKCTWTVNAYKLVDEKLPEPPTMFSDELYDKPDGIGITGIMKMGPGNQRMFNRALELGNVKQAEKLMRHHHLMSQITTWKPVEHSWGRLIPKGKYLREADIVNTDKYRKAISSLKASVKADPKISSEILRERFYEATKIDIKKVNDLITNHWSFNPSASRSLWIKRSMANSLGERKILADELRYLRKNRAIWKESRIAKEYFKFNSVAHEAILTEKIYTKAYLDAFNIKELEVYRGLRGRAAKILYTKEGKITSIKSNVASSWTANDDIAYKFAVGTGKEYGATLMTKINSKDIFSFYRATYYREEFEREVITLAVPGQKATVTVVIKPGALLD